jgi:virulence-associated protein VagC
MTDRTAGSDQPRRARLFWNGRSQAVRLPREFRFDGDEVAIRKDGDAVILEPVRKPQWPDGYWSWMDEQRDRLELGDIDAIGGALLDLSLDDDA